MVSWQNENNSQKYKREKGECQEGDVRQMKQLEEMKKKN